MGGASPSAHEVGEGDVEGVGDEEQVSEVRGRGAGFPPVDGFVIAADAFPEGHLGESGGAARFAEL
jgi:hypothetical protein